jgi:endo-1,4-beta-xylanase
LINDYNVLSDYGSCIDTYINVIKILKSRGLIDGIGCQSHGLENVNVANVKAKLDKLAATGLSVYISELDLNIADDTAQKNKMQELFPALYEHSAVKGVTLWGYVQGHTWVPNSYLLRSNGTERPALTWLKQYKS